MAAFVSEAIVTGSRRYGEADRLLTLFTRDRGRIGAIAKSARKPKSSIRGASEPFVRAKFELAEGKSLAIVRSAEIIEPHLGLRENWARLQLAGHVAEIANKMSEEGVPDPDLYDLLARALDSIGKDEANGNSGVVRFKVGLLDHLGVFPDLSGCAKCGSSRVKGDVHLDQANHGFLCGDCAKEYQVYHPVQMSVLHCVHAIRTGADLEETASEILESADDLLTTLLQAFLQAGFKTAPAARQARSAERRRGKDTLMSEDNNKGS